MIEFQTMSIFDIGEQSLSIVHYVTDMTAIPFFYLSEIFHFPCCLVNASSLRICSSLVLGLMDARALSK